MFNLEELYTHGFAGAGAGGFTNFMNAVSQQQQQEQQPQKTSPPPASRRLIGNLPMVTVTNDDLLEETNKECAICLETISCGSRQCKLPCGHLFNPDCLKEWLNKCCTCPVCRFELETDDSLYEKNRKDRMKTRKLRYRLDELNNKRISQLREMSTNLSVSISGCIDKSEIIDRLVASGRIDITEQAAAEEMSESRFQSLGVSELKTLLLSFGLSVENALEKKELRSRLLESGRVVLTASDRTDVEPAPEPIVPVSIEPPSPAPMVNEVMQIEVGILNIMSVRELKYILDDLCISWVGCFDRSELLDLIKSSSKISVI